MRKSRSGLFLMELIIIIFFFALTSAVCLQVFLKAHQVGKLAKEQNQAVLYATSVGEAFYEYGNDLESIKSVLGSVMTGYVVEVSLREDEDFLYCDFSCDYENSNTHLYDITFKSHIKEVSNE